MAVKIRLARKGRKKNPFYRVVVADVRMPRDGRCIEELGYYDPMLPSTDPKRVKINPERLAYWLKTGAQMTDKVAWFVKKGLVNLGEAA